MHFLQGEIRRGFTFDATEADHRSFLRSGTTRLKEVVEEEVLEEVVEGEAPEVVVLEEEEREEEEGTMVGQLYSPLRPLQSQNSEPVLTY